MLSSSVSIEFKADKIKINPVDKSAVSNFLHESDKMIDVFWLGDVNNPDYEDEEHHVGSIIQMKIIDVDDDDSVSNDEEEEKKKKEKNNKKKVDGNKKVHEEE